MFQKLAGLFGKHRGRPANPIRKLIDYLEKHSWKDCLEHRCPANETKTAEHRWLVKFWEWKLLEFIYTCSLKLFGNVIVRVFLATSLTSGQEAAGVDNFNFLQYTMRRSLLSLLNECVECLWCYLMKIHPSIHRQFTTTHNINGEKYEIKIFHSEHTSI